MGGKDLLTIVSKFFRTSLSVDPEGKKDQQHFTKFSSNLSFSEIDVTCYIIIPLYPDKTFLVWSPTNIPLEFWPDKKITGTKNVVN